MNLEKNLDALAARHRQQQVRQTMLQVSGLDPDKEAEKLNVAAQTGVPAIAVNDDLREAASKPSLPQSNLEDSPALQSLLSEPRWASVTHDDVANLQQVEYQVRLDKPSTTLDELGGTLKMQQAYGAYIAATLGMGDPAELASLIARRNREVQQNNENAPYYVREFQRDLAGKETVLGDLAAGVANPRAVGRLTVSQLGSAAPSLVGMIGGTAVAGVPGAVAGSALLGIMTEYGASINEDLAKRGVDLTDEAAIASALQNPELMADLRERGLKKGITTGATDAILSVLLPGQLLRRAAPDASLANKAARGAGDVAVGAGTEGASEAAGQLARDGEIDTQEVALEILGGAGTGAIETASNVGLLYREEIAGRQQRLQQRIAKIHERAQATKTASRSPEALREMIDRIDPEAKVYLDGEAANTLYQSLPEEERIALSNAIPEFESQLMEAAASGGDLVLNQAEYIAGIASRPGLNAFQDHTRFNVGDLSTAQLSDEALINEKIQALLDDQEAERQAGEATDPAALSDQGRVFESWYDMGIKAGYSPSEARTYATVQSNAHNALTSDYIGGEKAVSAVAGVLDNAFIEAEGRTRLRRQGDTLDLQIDKARQYFKQKARTEAKQEARPLNLFGGKAAPKREKATPTPLISWLEKQGGVAPDSNAAGDLRAILDKRSARVVKAKGKLRIDAIPAVEFNAAFNDRGLVAEDDGNGYVDRQWLLDQIREETFGNYAKTTEERTREAEIEAFATLREQVQEATGLDLTEASNDQVRQALQLDGDILNQTILPEKITIDGKERWTVNSNGKLIAQTEEGIRNFWKWFGDSKVVDADGRPLVMYHTRRSGNDFIVFKNGSAGLIWFSESAKGSRMAALGQGDTVEVYLKATSPYNTKETAVHFMEIPHTKFDEKLNRVTSVLEHTGHDLVYVEDESGIAFAVQSATQIKSATGNSGAFDPNDARILDQSERGSITFLPDGKSVITMFEGRDRSTLLHEMGHLYIKALRAAVSQPDASDAVKTDWQTLKDFVGAKDDTFTVEQEEKLARGFELYLFEGNAPSQELQSVFRRIKAWMLRIYRDARRLNVKLNKDVRAVFDRMLATEEQINRLKQQQQARLDPAIMEMLNQPERERYAKLVENGYKRAEEKLLVKALKQYEAQAGDEYKAERKAVEEEQRTILNASPLSRALHFLITGEGLDGQGAPLAPGKLDRDEIIRRYGKEVIPYLPRGSTAKGGYPLAIVAEAFGIDNGETLIQGLRGHPGLKAALQSMTDAEMMNRHGDMLRDGTIEREAAEMVATSPERGERIAWELRAISRKSNETVIPTARLASAAKEIVGRTPLKKLSAERYRLAERKAAFESGRALGRGEYGVAAEWKRKQYLNYHLYREARAAQARVDRALNRFKLFNKSHKRLGLRIDVDYVNAARTVLAKFGLSRKQINVADWLAQIKAEDGDLHARLSGFIAAWEAQDRRYNDLTVTEFSDLADGIENLVATGRAERQTMLDGRLVDNNEIRGKLVDALQKRPARRQVVGRMANGFDSLANGISGVRASSRIIESWVTLVDGGDFSGAWRTLFFDPVINAEGRYRDARHAKFLELQKVVAPHRERINNPVEIVAHELQSYDSKKQAYVKQTFKNKAELLGMLQHTGNASNLDKLLRGYGWDQSALESFIFRMHQEKILTKDDWDLLQGIWDFYESMKPEVQKAHKQIYGYRFKEIQAQPIDTPFGDYRGGYVPAKIDASKAKSAGTQQTLEQVIDPLETASLFPSAPTGFTKERQQRFAEPLLMDLNLITEHLESTLKFIHLQAPVQNAARILKGSPELQQALFDVDGNILNKALAPWLGRIARQRVQEPGQNRWVGSMLNIMRQRTSAQYIMFNISNTLQQYTGLFPGMVKTGSGEFVRAAGQYLQNPGKMHRVLREKSELLRNRQETFADDVERNVREILRETPLIGKGDAWAAKHGYLLQRISQGHVDSIVWLAAYNKAMKGKSKGVNAGDDGQSARYADSVVRETQGGNAPSQVADIVTGTPLMRLMTLFYSYFNTMGNLVLTEMQMAKGDLGRQATIIGLTVMAPAITANLIATALKGDWPEDDDDDGTVIDDVFFQTVTLPVTRYSTALVPFGTTIANPLIGMFTPETYDDRVEFGGATIAAATKTLQAPYHIYRAVADDGDQSRAVQSTMTGLGMITGLPLGQLGKPLGYAANVAEGDEEPESAADVARGLVSGPSFRR